MIAQTEVNWRVDSAISGGGLFHDLAPHQLDILYHLFGNAKAVNGYATNQAGMYTADDLVSGSIVFNSNIVVNGLWCFSVPESEVKDECEIVGSTGKISFPFFGDRFTVCTDGNEEEIHLPYPQHVQQPMIEEVVKYFLGTAPNPCTAEEAATIMQWIDTMTKPQ
jgi:predicted dehydrogenase